MTTRFKIYIFRCYKVHKEAEDRNICSDPSKACYCR